MLQSLRAPSPWLLAAVLLSGCGSSSHDSTRGIASVITAPPAGNGGGAGTGNPAPPGISVITGSLNSVVATASVGGTVAVAVGANETVSIAFTSSDGLAISGFGISGNLSTLPAGWSGPGSFSCASVSIGNGCVLNLTYSPLAAAAGTLSLDCVFIDNAAMPRTPGPCVTLVYTATPQNNVVASASQTGQIVAAIGAGTASVSVNFITDNGDAATDFTLTSGLSSLPSGWSSTATGLACPIVSTGSGCQLPLSFQPTTAARGTLTLNYSYTDESGAAKTGQVNIPYSTSAGGSLMAIASPSGQVSAVQMTGGQSVTVTFTTDDGKPARNIALTTDLAHLPPGWHSTSTGFSCGSAGTGNGCQLPLSYAPTALASGTLALNYAYDDSAGAARSGVLNIPYVATTNDNVVGTPSPSGQVNAVVGLGTQPVTVTFTSDDGRPATALQITGGLAALPAGWTGGGALFACSGLGSGTGCQVSLAYAPASADSGTLALSYGYKNNAGVSKLGTVNIPYRATTDDNVVGTPSQNPLAVGAGSSTPVNIVFTTDDGNLATGLSITSDLSVLPAGWSSGSGSFSCPSLSTGQGCQLSLIYAPVLADSGTLTLSFSYINDSGIAKTATAAIAYTATP